MKLIKIDKQDYKKSIPYSVVKYKLSWLTFIEGIKQNNGLGFFELEAPETMVDLTYFFGNNLIRCIMSEVKKLDKDEADTLVNKAVLSTLLNKFNLSESIVLDKVVDVEKLLKEHGLKVKKIEDEVLEYNLYFRLNDTLCRFHYDTQWNIIGQLNNIRENLEIQLENLDNDRLGMLESSLEDL